jgi:subtilisin-like proprotein convertase family protein
MKRLYSLLFTPLLTFSVSAQNHTETYSFNGVNVAVPDGSSVGVVNQQTLTTGIDSISSITVSVNLSGTAIPDNVGYNGDLYVYLSHDTGFSVLLNRVGRAIGRATGYDDEGGIDVTFDDAALNDIHTYQEFVGDPGTFALDGNWKPDARESDPEFVLDTDSRTALLDSFTTLNGDGDWSLFLADLNGGAEHTLNSWSISITGVPEPGTATLLALAGLVLIKRRSRFTRGWE